MSLENDQISNECSTKLGLDLFPELMNPVIENLVPEPKEPYEVQRESTPISLVKVVSHLTLMPF